MSKYQLGIGSSLSALLGMAFICWSCSSTSTQGAGGAGESGDAGSDDGGTQSSGGATTGRAGAAGSGAAPHGGTSAAGGTDTGGATSGTGGAPEGGTASGAGGSASGAGGSASGAGGSASGAGGSASGAGGSASGAGGSASGAGGSASGAGGSASGAGGSASGAGGAGGVGGAGQAGAALALSAASLAFGPATCGSNAANPAQSFSITNNGSAAIAWYASVSTLPTYFTLTPNEGTLAPGATTSVTVAPPSPLPGNLLTPKDVPQLSRTIVVSGDPSGALSIPVQQTLHGDSFAWSPQWLDFGSVAVGSSKTLTVTASYGLSTIGPELSSNGLRFTPSAFDGIHPTTWTVTFAPLAAGPQMATLSFFTQTSLLPACTPQTFPAYGTGGVASSCSAPGAKDGTLCGGDKVCLLIPGSPLCLTELTLTGSSVVVTPGTPFSGTVATGGDLLPNSSTMSASIDWGDSTVSAGTIVSSWTYTGNPSDLSLHIPLSVTGTHTYATAGAHLGTATITDSATGLSTSASFTASN